MTALPMPILEEALKKILAGLMEKCRILQAVLYGSYARGEARSSSDVDLLLLVDDDPQRCEEQAAELALKLGLPVLQPIALTLEEIRRDEEKKRLYYNALLDGLILYHSLNTPPAKTAPQGYEPCLLIKYKAPRKILKKLVGTTVTLGNRRLRARGLIEKLGGIRIAPGLIIVPAKNEQTLQQVLQQLGVEYQVIAIILASKKQLETTTRKKKTN